MERVQKKLPPSKQTAAKVIYEAFKILKNAGGQLSGREVTEQVGKNVEFTSWEQERYAKSGYIRWQSILHFYTIDAIKAGFLRKQKGIWILTSEGEKALELGATKLLEKVSNAYREWSEQNRTSEIVTEESEAGTAEQSQITNNDVQLQIANNDLLEEQALDGLREYLKKKNPYEFQDIVAALLHAMGYEISFVSPKGKDQGIDIVAYQDPLGVKTPRIKIQVKHRPDANIAVNEIRGLAGLLNKEGDVGLFVTSGHFTADSEIFARNLHIHMELIDFERFIFLWREFYNKLSDIEKNMLPLQAIYFLGTNK